MEHPEHTKYIAALLIILLGAVVNATEKLRKARKEKVVFTLADWLILCPASILGGILFGLFAASVGGGTLQVLFAGGIGSLLGIQGLNELALRYLKK